MSSRRLLPIALALLLAAPALAQPDEQREAERRLRELREQIGQFEQQLAATRREETDAARALEELDREIALREALMDSYRQRLGSLATESQAIQESMAALGAELEALREEYRRHARRAYMRGRLGDLALIFSAGSINQMLVRVRYLQRFSERRQNKLAQVRATQEELASRQAALDSAAVRTQELLAESREEQATLGSRKRERAALVATIRERRTTLQAELARRQQESDRLEARIQEIIAAVEAERRRAAEEERRRAAAAAAADRPPPAAGPAESAVVRLSGSFRQNRGSLPWPASGVVTGAFGLRTHPVHGTRTRSIGIEIATSAQTPVRSVFDGKVERIFAMPGYGTCVMVSHGDYATIYGNLSSVQVRQGQQLRAGEALGRSGTSAEPLGAGVFFALFASGQAEDPLPWLQRR